MIAVRGRNEAELINAKYNSWYEKLRTWFVIVKKKPPHINDQPSSGTRLLLNIEYWKQKTVQTRCYP